MNALMKLNQLKPGLQYKLVSQTGPVHAPIFTMSVEIDGSTFEASGPSKKTAKLHVAVKVRAVCGNPAAGLSFEAAWLGRARCSISKQSLDQPSRFLPQKRVGHARAGGERTAVIPSPAFLTPGVARYGFTHRSGRQRVWKRR